MGTSNPAPTFSYAGFVAGEDESVLTTPPSVETDADITSPAGSYALTAFGAASPNYTISYRPGTLTVFRTALPGYSGALNYVSNLASESSSEATDDDLKRLFFQIEGSGMRLPNGVQ